VKEKEYNSPDSFLVSLKNKISVALGIDPHRLNLLIGQFVDQTLPELDSVRKRYIRTNIFSEFTKDKMTIKVFFKFLRIINIKKINFKVTVTTSKDKEFTVEQDVSFFTQDYKDVYDDK